MFLKVNSIDRGAVDVVTVGFEGERLLLERSIDALDAVAYAIPRTRRKGYSTSFIFYSESGIPDSPFLVFAARKDWVADNLGMVRGFLRQTREAFGAVDSWGIAEWNRYVEGLPERNGAEEMEIWRATSPLMRGTVPMFQQDLSALDALADLLRGWGSIGPDLVTGDIFLNVD
jgi:ABC-type nitrate/sulfonate/bicarbonate transport system substrate-binding protein